MNIVDNNIEEIHKYMSPELTNLIIDKSDLDIVNIKDMNN